MSSAWLALIGKPSSRSQHDYRVPAMRRALVFLNNAAGNESSGPETTHVELNMNAPAYILPRPESLRRDGPMIFASGLLATITMTTIMFVLPLIGLGDLPLPLLVARLFGQVDLPLWVARLFTGNPGGVAAFAIGLHVFLGFGYAWLYAGEVEPRLTLRPAVAGLVFGLMLWLLAQAVAVGAIARGAGGSAGQLPGFLALGLGPWAALSSLVAHLAYGVTLGSVYGCHCGGTCRGGKVE